MLNERIQFIIKPLKNTAVEHVRTYMYFKKNKRCHFFYSNMEVIKYETEKTQARRATQTSHGLQQYHLSHILLRRAFHITMLYMLLFLTYS